MLRLIFAPGMEASRVRETLFCFQAGMGCRSAMTTRSRTILWRYEDRNLEQYTFIRDLGGAGTIVFSRSCCEIVALITNALHIHTSKLSKRLLNLLYVSPRLPRNLLIYCGSGGGPLLILGVSFA